MKKKENKNKPKKTELIHEQAPKPLEQPPELSVSLEHINPKDVQKKIARLHEECPKYSACTKREFLIGLGFGIMIGVIAMMILWSLP